MKGIIIPEGVKVMEMSWYDSTRILFLTQKEEGKYFLAFTFQFPFRQPLLTSTRVFIGRSGNLRPNGLPLLLLPFLR